MIVIGINGSPRKNWNTAKLLAKALEGAASQGADTKLVCLYDLVFKGCTSCFACKLIDGPHNGRCALNASCPAPHYLISTSAQTGTYLATSLMSALNMRTQPWLAIVPMLQGSSLPWM